MLSNYRMANREIWKSFRTLLVVISVTFSILIVFFAIYQNSIFDIPKDYNVLIERIQDTTTNIQKTRNTITIRDGEEKNSYISEPVADKDLENNAFKDTKNNLSLSTTVVNDKLLNGLLSSSFEEASCISRFQSYLYQKISPYKPSKYLISKLRNYEHLHQSCGPYTKSYNEIIKEGAKVSENGVDSKCKYFIWTVEDGLGNRMISMVSAFLYAILTDRVLLVRFGDDMLNLFCEPFPNSSWLLPKNSPYWNNLKQFETHKIIFIDNKENNSRELLQPALVINLRHTHAGPTNRFHCDKNQHHLQKIPVLILQSNEYFVPTLYMVSSFREDFNKMFPDKDTIFHHLGRYLFQPSNVAWERIRNLYEEHLAKENERIGLQIRVFNTRQAPPQTVIDEIISCIHQNKLLPKFNMHNLTTLSLKNNTSKVVLVVSLYSKYGEGLKRLYQNNTTLSREVIKVYQPSHEEHQNSRNSMHNIKAWTDIYLLSLCNSLVTSTFSTFGYVASSLAGLKPLILKNVYGKKVPNPPCEQVKYMEPCFLDPPIYDCRTNTKIDYTSVFLNMKHCEDHAKGIKMINI
ncbi:probable fucosyltransferase 8 isoform X1 [Vigna angularis]|nr:probable fucosyltransferase 8 isoform X1 [Vigna angularis]